MERRLKILMCAYAVDDKDVGEANLTFEWVQKVSEFADVTLITRGSRIHEVCGFENNANVEIILARPSLTFMWTGAFDRVIKPDYVEFYIRARRAAKHLINCRKFDVCHHIAPHSPRYPSPLHGLGLRMLVGPIHGGLHVPKQLRRKSLTSIVSDLAKSVDKVRYAVDPLMRAHFRCADKLLISAPYVRDILPARHADKCQVIPPQPAKSVTSDYRNARKDNTVRFIFVGRLIPSKGVDLALEAFIEAKKTRPARFDIYGDGELRDDLADVVRKNGVEGQVTLHGFTKHEVVLREFAKSDVLLFPSLKEAWGLVVSEAMSAGLPVICVDRGGPGYMVDESTGVKVACSQRMDMVQNLSRAIDCLIDSEEVRIGKGKNAKAKAESSFTWAAVIDSLKGLYEASVDSDALP